LEGSAPSLPPARGTDGAVPSNPSALASSTFRLFLKPFMDAWTWDEDRIDRCCTHVIRPDGVLDSFCRYYAAAR
jgi:uncharacterized radical SAM superfamily Fe-S cluster-containing enzyme